MMLLLEKREKVKNKKSTISIRYYLFICFFIGNDFIIHTPSINIRYGGINILLNTYQKLQQDYFGNFFIIDDHKINILNLTLFIKELASNENKNINNILEIRDKKEHFYKKKYNHILKKWNIKRFDQFDEITNTDINVSEDYFQSMKGISPLLFREKEKKLFNNNKNYYTFTLYQVDNYNPSFNIILQKDIHTLCEEYFKSIQWTFSYYFNNCLSWRWYYQYHSAPLMNDLYDYLSNYNEDKPLFTDIDQPFLPVEQLKIVLPYQEDTYMYPTKSPLYSLLKTYHWECHPILPHK